MNINLNVGGIVGGLLTGAVVGIVVVCGLDDASRFEGFHAKLIIGSLIGGAFLGNLIWAYVFKKQEPSATDAPAKPLHG